MPISAEEISLDVEWAHAIAPRPTFCLSRPTISSEAFVSVICMLPVNVYARSVPGVVVISNSCGSEWSKPFMNLSMDSTYSTPAGHVGVTFVFSAGDDGAPAAYPSASPNVLSVGGTSFTLTSSNDYSSEVVWNGGVTGGASGGGASLYENVPNYQQVVGPHYARNAGCVFQW